MTNERLHQKTCQRGRQPEKRKILLLGTKILIDGGHVPHLETPAHLDAQVAKRHIPKRPECFFGRLNFIHGETGFMGAEMALKVPLFLADKAWRNFVSEDLDM